VVTSSVIASDFDVVRVAVFPAEAHAELIVYADAVLFTAVTLGRFDTVARRHPKISRRTGRFEVFLFAASEAFHVHQAANSYAVEQSLRVLLAKVLIPSAYRIPGHETRQINIGNRRNTGSMRTQPTVQRLQDVASG